MCILQNDHNRSDNKTALFRFRTVAASKEKLSSQPERYIKVPKLSNKERIRLNLNLFECELEQ